jgi:hypothetical protein
MGSPKKEHKLSPNSLQIGLVKISFMNIKLTFIKLSIALLSIAIHILDKVGYLYIDITPVKSDTISN